MGGDLYSNMIHCGIFVKPPIGPSVGYLLIHPAADGPNDAFLV